MNPNVIKAIIFGLIVGVPLILAQLLPQFFWVFFFVIAIEIYAMVAKRVRSKSLKFVISGILIYGAYQFFHIFAGLFILYWIIGSIGFGFISSIIIFGIGGP